MPNWIGSFPCHYWGDKEWEETINIKRIKERHSSSFRFFGWINISDPSFPRTEEIVGDIIPKGSDFLIKFILMEEDDNIYYHSAAYRTQTHLAKGEWTDADGVNQGKFSIDFNHPVSETAKLENILTIEPGELESDSFLEDIDKIERYFKAYFDEMGK